MVLTDILRGIRPSLVGLALAFSPMYACGGEESSPTSQGCTEDFDCKSGNKICIDQKCEYKPGNSQNQYTVSSACDHLVGCYNSNPNIEYESWQRNLSICGGEFTQFFSDQGLTSSARECLLQCATLVDCTKGQDIDDYCDSKCNID